jgi:hypothetical protein
VLEVYHLTGGTSAAVAALVAVAGASTVTKKAGSVS